MLTHPEFETVRPYVLNYLNKNYWKVQSLLSWDDAVGEAQLQFWRTVTRLQKRNCIIENEKHLMALFKTSWNNHFITLSNKATHQIPIVELVDDSQQSLIEEVVVGALDNDGFLHVLLDKAPTEIKQVLLLMLKIPSEIVEQICQSLPHHPEQGNMILCRLLGKPHESQLLQKTIQYFKE